MPDPEELSPQIRCVLIKPIVSMDVFLHDWSTFRSLNSLVVFVMAISTGNLSMLDAPKKPWTPVVRLRTYSASFGSAIGPPWQRTRMSRLILVAASLISWINLTQSSSDFPVLAPIDPDVVNPIWQTSGGGKLSERTCH